MLGLQYCQSEQTPSKFHTAHTPTFCISMWPSADIVLKVTWVVPQCSLLDEHLCVGVLLRQESLGVWMCALCVVVSRTIENSAPRATWKHT